jgi:hypothetical protein
VCHCASVVIEAPITGSDSEGFAAYFNGKIKDAAKNITSQYVVTLTGVSAVMVCSTCRCPQLNWRYNVCERAEIHY